MIKNKKRKCTQPSLAQEDDYQLVVEPGRSIMATAGVMVCSVLGTKVSGDKRYLVVDGSMTDLIRPALYGAYHHVVPCVDNYNNDDQNEWDVVGPVCESADVLASKVRLPTLIKGLTLKILANPFILSSRRSHSYHGYWSIWKLYV